jgi:hypothetical protein
MKLRAALILAGKHIRKLSFRAEGRSGAGAVAQGLAGRASGQGSWATAPADSAQAVLKSASPLPPRLGPPPLPIRARAADAAIRNAKP